MPDTLPAIPDDDEPSEYGAGYDASADDALGDGGFYENLALRLSATQRKTIASRMLEAIERDDESRREWKDIYVKGLKQLGYDRKADLKSTPFPGSATVVHPMIAQAGVEYASRAIKELCPPGGCTRTQILGKETPEKLARADRLKEHMDWQQTYLMAPEWRDEYERMLMQEPIIGSGFRKLWFDPNLGRPRVEYIRDLIVPYLATSLADAARVTQQMVLDELEFQARIDSGLYMAPGTGGAPGQISPDKIQEQQDKIQGVKPDSQNLDEARVVYECHHYLSPEEAGDDEVAQDAGDRAYLPYIGVYDEFSGDMLALRRNWKDGDPKFTKRAWFVHYKFFPWEGFYGVGLIHLIGGLDRAATAALRAMLDAGLSAVANGGLRLKGSGVSGGNMTMDPYGFNEIDVDGVDDIRKVFMSFPTNGAQAMGPLFQLLGFLDQKGAAFISVMGDVAQAANANMPVGTMAMLVEHGSTVYSAIHARAHASQREELRILASINADTLDDTQTVKTFGGELVVQRADYADDIDVQPVSDPNIFAEGQRYAQGQMVLQIQQEMAAFPGGVTPWAYQGFLNMLEVAKVPQPERFLPPPPPPAPPPPQPLDPAAELVAMMQGIHVQAFPGQQHLAHLQTMMAFMASPVFGGLEAVRAKMGQNWLSLATQRLALWFLDTMQADLSQQVGQPVQLGQPQPPPIAAKIAEAIAAASPLAMQQAAQLLGSVPPIVDAVWQTVKTLSQPQDPKAAQDQAQIAQKAQADAMDYQAKMAAVQQKAAEDLADNQTARDIAAAKIEAGERGSVADFTDGASLGGNPRDVRA